MVVIDIKTPSGNREEIKKLESKGVCFKYPVFLQEVKKDSVILKDEASNLKTVPIDTVIAFTNEVPVLDFLPEKAKKNLDNRGFFTVPEQKTSFRTAHPNISIVGDAGGLGLVTTHIGRARECAREVHALLQGEEYVPLVKDPILPADLHPERNLPEEPSLHIEEECRRCLHCGICIQCDDCVEACPREALKREGEEFSVDLFICGGCGTCAAACKGGVICMVPR